MILDFVPNHLGLDHSWVTTHPERFVGQQTPFDGSFPVETAKGPRYLAHGKDPYFPGWTDTVQIDYRKPDTREAMLGLLLEAASRCDGVRCDMAMLLISDVFNKTWQHVPAEGGIAAGEFWEYAIAIVKKKYPNFVFLAEAYWGLEGRLCDLGFDFAYDKHLYDLIIHDRFWDVQPHLAGMGSHNQKRAHFLENHDEPRVALELDWARHRAALVLIMGLPGMRFLHDGQFEGLRRFARVQLGRRAQEPEQEDISRMYHQILTSFAQSAVAKGEGQILIPRRAWDDNPTSQCIQLTLWQDVARPGHFDLVVVNMASHRSQCRVDLPVAELGNSAWLMADRLGEERWDRDGNSLAREGLYLDVDARGAHIYSFTKE